MTSMFAVLPRTQEALRGELISMIMPSSESPLRQRYRLEGVLGRGGSSTVFRARDLLTDRVLAVKEISLEASGPQRRAALLDQFRLESQLLCALEHPGLPSVQDSFVEGDFCYLVMDCIEGANLLNLVRERGRLPERTALEWARQIAAALAYLHSRTPPVILRDLKPSNLMITRDQRVKLIDFGIAKLHDPGRGLETRTSARGLLTPGFASPEQYSGGTDASSDLYSLGATMYYMLTGQVPPESVELLTGESQLVPLQALRPDLSPAARELVVRLMELRRENRFRSALDVHDRLEVLLKAGHGATLAEPIRRRQPPPPAQHRLWRTAMLIVGLGVFVLPALPRIWGVTLKVDSDPPNARVFVNTREVGLTPLEVALPRGPASVHVALAGRIPVTDSMLLERGRFAMHARLLPAEPRNEAEQKAFERLLFPPNLADPPAVPAPGYYPPSKGGVPWHPPAVEQRELLGLCYAVPSEWTVTEEELSGDRGRVLLNAPTRSLELVVRPLEDWPSVVDTETQLLEQEGWERVSTLQGEQRASVRCQRPESARLVRIYLKREDRMARLELVCEPCPEAAYLIQQLDLLRSHVEAEF